jgi:hypothetical protein
MTGNPTPRKPTTRRSVMYDTSTVPSVRRSLSGVSGRNRLAVPMRSGMVTTTASRKGGF